MTHARRSRGFSLIELMMVVAIVGVLSSVALPAFGRTSVRSKTAERPVVMGTILRGIEDLYRRNGAVVIPAAAANPATPGMQRQSLNRAAAGWSTLFGAVDIDGAVYYSYTFSAWEGATPGASVTAIGDLDGDGVPSVKTITYNRVNGVYLVATELPAPGNEDAVSF